MMRYFWVTFMSLAVLAGTAEAHPMNGPGGGMNGCGMMGGRGGGMHGAMGAYRHWIDTLMMHRDALDLSAEQTDRIGALSATLAQRIITNNAKYRVLEIDYRQAMRKRSVDQKAVEKILKQQADLQYENRMLGVTFYTQVLALMTPEQKGRLWDVVGSPFPHRWDENRPDGRFRQRLHGPMVPPPGPQPGHHPPAGDMNDKSDT